MMCNITPAGVSQFFKAQPMFKQKCLDAVSTGYKTLLIVSNTYLTKGEYDRWKENNDLIRQFVFQMNEWECYCKSSAVTPEKFIKAFLLYKYPDEIATAVGMTTEDYVSYILENEFLQGYMHKMQGFIFRTA